MLRAQRASDTTTANDSNLCLFIKPPSLHSGREAAPVSPAFNAKHALFDWQWECRAAFLSLRKFSVHFAGGFIVLLFNCFFYFNIVTRVRVFRTFLQYQKGMIGVYSDGADIRIPAHIASTSQWRYAAFWILSKKVFSIPLLAQWVSKVPLLASRINCFRLATYCWSGSICYTQFNR